MLHQDNRLDRNPTVSDDSQTVQEFIPVQYVKDNYPKYSKPKLRSWLDIRQEL